MAGSQCIAPAAHELAPLGTAASSCAPRSLLRLLQALDVLAPDAVRAICRAPIGRAEGPPLPPVRAHPKPNGNALPAVT